MSLRVMDIGTGWHDNLRQSLNYTTINIFPGNLTSGESVIMSNMTSIIVSDLLVFNSSEAFLGWFNISSGMIFHFSFKDVGIGEKGYIYGYCGIGSTVTIVVVFDDQGFYPNPSNIVTHEFIEGKVLSSITVLIKGVDTPTQPRIWDFILDVCAKQLQKIDRYSS
jgi:hypothetical protein